MKKKILGSLIVAGMLFTTGCMKEKKIPAEQLVTIYDSNLQETNKIAPLETMYVKVAGLEANKLHRIEVLDPNLKLISYAEVVSNDEGVIEPMPIWYDVGLEKQEDGNFTITKEDLSLKAFYIKVKSVDDSSTDFKQDFFLLLKKPNSADDMPKPVVASVSKEDGETVRIENTFLETGSKNPDGSDSNLTKVYVKADQLPYKTIKDGKVVDTDKVDIYVIPFSGGAYENGMDLQNIAVTVRKDVATDDNKTFRTLEPTLVWDLNKNPKLINPGDSNNAYSIVIDTNQNGKFDIGEDLDGDGKYDRYIDGIDGQSAAGFIVMNTEANNISYKITDEAGNKSNTLNEHKSGDDNDLYFAMNNIPTSQDKVKIYVIDKDVNQLEDGTDLKSNDVRKGDGDNKGTEVDVSSPDNNLTFMPYIKASKFLNTKDDEYSYQKDIDEVKNLDIVVDVNEDGEYNKSIDYYIPNSVTIYPFNAKVTTTVNSDGEGNTSVFNEANSEANTTIYVKYGDGSKTNCSADTWAYLFPANQTPSDDDELFGEITRVKIATDNNCLTKFVDTTEMLKNNILKVINPTYKNNKYVIVIDDNDDHKYTNDDDKILNISFKDTSANSLPDVSYINLASGGLMGRPYQHWVDTPYTSAYDYRDTFTVSASDTVPTEWWWARYWITKGVKVVWNPYIKDRGWWRRKSGYINEKGEENESPLNNRQIVDLYIIDANKYQLIKDMKLTDEMDVKGRHLTLPVQFSCRNGAYLQTIWKAPLKVGKYYVVVDINRNGQIDDGIDLIDAVTKTGVTIKDDPSVVGFSVVDK